MKKYKLSKKAESYLKAQEGLQVPYENPYQDNTTPFDLGQIDPSLQAAQQNQIVQAPSSTASTDQKSNVLGSLSNFGSLGAGIKMGTGLISLFQSFEEKRKAKRREFNAKKDLENRMKEIGIPAEELSWYLDTRRFGSCPHAGFGLGFERLVLFVTGMTNIRDVIPFPRTPKNCEF